MGLVTRAGVAAAIAAAQVGLAYRFALAYRARAGYPRRFPPTIMPSDVGLPFDRSRKDAARLIRDLRFRAKSHDRHKAVRWKFVLVALALSLGVSFLALREIRVKEQFDSIPQAPESNLASLRRRLSDLDAFAERYPIWHGGIGVVKERAKLRVAVERLEEEAENAREEQEVREQERLESAKLARDRGMMKAADGDFAGAIAEFEQALEVGGADWPPRAEIERNIQAMRAHLGAGTVEGR